MNENNRKFTSSIGHHSSYIWETKKILKEYLRIRSYDKLRVRVIDDNILNKASESYRGNILKEITRRYIPDKNEFEETPLMEIINASLSDSKKDWIIYYEFSKDKLVYEIITSFIYKKYSNGATKINKEEVIDYIYKLRGDHPEINDWSEYTILQIGEHILSSLKNFGILEGSKGKKFKYLTCPKETIIYTLYSLIEDGTERSKDIISHDDWKLYFLDKNGVRKKLSNISPEFIRYEKRGSVEKIDPKYNSLSEVIDDF